MEQHHPDAIVVWIDGARATSEESEVIYDAVLRRRLTRFEDVAEAVAAELFARDRRRIGGDADAMEQLRAWYLVAARRLLRARNGTLLRITTSTASPPLPPEASGAPPPWRRPIGFYAALGGFLAAFQHVVQRHVFQGRALDLGSGLVLGAYVAVGVLGVRWLLESRTGRGPTRAGWKQC